MKNEVLPAHPHDLCLVHRFFPLKMHSSSADLEGLSDCACSKDTARRIDADVALGSKYGVQAVPTLFINGGARVGIISASDRNAAVEAQLKARGSGADVGSAAPPN